MYRGRLVYGGHPRQGPPHTIFPPPFTCSPIYVEAAPLPLSPLPGFQIRETVARSHLVLLDNKRLRGKLWNYWKRTRIDFLMHCSWQQKRTKNAWFSIFVCLLDGFWEANWWVRGRVRNHPVEVSCSFSFVAEDKEVVKFLPPMEATATTRMNKLQLHHIWLHPQTTSALQIPLRIHHMERW